MKKIGIIVVKIATTSVLLVMLLTSACKKDAPTMVKTIIEHDTVQHSWNEDQKTFIMINKYYNNCMTRNGCVGFTNIAGYNINYDSSATLSSPPSWEIGVNDYNLAFNPLVQTRTVMNENFAIQISNNLFTITWPYYRYSGSADRDYFFKNIDTSYKDISALYPNNVMYSVAQINDSGRIVIPVYTSTSFGYNTFYLLDIKTTYNTSSGAYPHVSSYDTSHFKKLNIASSSTVTTQTYNTCGNIKNNLFVYCNNSTYILRPDYSYTAVCNSNLCSFFNYANSYYAVGFQDNAIYQTNDLGETWAKVVTLSGSINSGYGLGIFNFDNKLIAMLNSQIWLLSISGSNFTFKEIVNDGLAGKLITSITKCNNTVFLATNAGIYTRPYSQFYQFK